MIQLQPFTLSVKYNDEKNKLSLLNFIAIDTIKLQLTSQQLSLLH